MIPHCDKVFKDYIANKYPDGYFNGRKVMTKGDMLHGYYKICENPRDLSELTTEWQDKVIYQINIMIDSALKDWERILNKSSLSYEFGLKLIDAYYTKSRIADLLKHDKLNTDDGDVFVMAMEIGFIAGRVLIERNSKWDWLPCWPYWESPIYHKGTGCIANVFHWGVKKLSSYGVDDDLYNKCLACDEIAENEFNENRERG